jgi:hypothetical protein
MLCGISAALPPMYVLHTRLLPVVSNLLMAMSVVPPAQLVW